ncbi:apolipoprotein N-acyltransferase [Desertivirga arenae]|uniref:apolipoprotein N-acyltransferase n=1 Tax=Desertivirga arenae TaxID=2810309 RepID=UPI001A960AC5
MQKLYLKALTTALLLWLAWPPMSFTAPLLLVAFVPLLLSTEAIIDGQVAKKGQKIFGLAFLTFFIWNTSCIYWVFNSLNSVMPAWVAILISLIPFGLAAVLMTIAWWLYYQLRKVSNRFTGYVGLVCFWVGYEYLHQTWDLSFPWMTLGNGFASSHQLVQWYEYTGVYGGTIWILVANILTFELTLARSVSDDKAVARQKKLLPGLSAWVLVPIMVSLTMYNKYQEHENPANVVVVQPNVDPYEKFGSLPGSLQIQNLIKLSDSLGQPNTEYFIWPETAITDNADEDKLQTNPDFLRIQSFLGKYKNGNVLSGIESFAWYDTEKTETARLIEENRRYIDVFNAAIQIENSSRVQLYHKSKLVPGVEQTPFAHSLAFLKPLFKAFGGATGDYGHQDEPSVFYAQSGMGVSPVICYESIWGEYVAESVKKGAQFIAIVTNDGWWGNTSGKDQHFAYAKLRAIESRRWVARSANTGISGFINQRGDVVKQSKWWMPTALKADINLNEELTFYVKYGDYVAYLAIIAGIALIILLAFRKLSGKVRK